MGFGDISGKARTSPRNPQAFGVCDRCGTWFQRRDLLQQLEYRGNALQWTGFLVCRQDYDEPQSQLRPILLPPDPVPVVNPRPEYSFQTIDYPLGFTQYALWPDGKPINYGVVIGTQTGQPVTDNNGVAILVEIGSDATALLAQVADLSGIPVPATVIPENGTIAAAVTAQTLVSANPSRTYLAIINPCTAPMAVSTGNAQVGVFPSVNLGPGEALFWATAQGKGTIYQGAMTIACDIPGLPYYCFEG